MSFAMRILPLILLLILEFTAPAHAESLRERLAGFSVGAHRGGAYGLDSNTIHRFEKAKHKGADIVEMDLRATKDGVPVVIHDEKLAGFGKAGRGVVSEMTLAEVKACKAFPFYPIPTFEEVLQWADGTIVVNAEFKTLDVILPSIKLIQKYDAYDWVYFQTKSDHARYEMARSEDSRVNLLYKPVDDADLLWALGLDDENLVVIELYAPTRTPENIERIHAHRKLASENSWHFSRTRELFGAACKKVFALGIDIAITERPRGCGKASAVKGGRF